jgi:sec-independent protein translocase protein TatC
LFAAAFVTGFLSSGIILRKILGFVHIEDVTIAASSPFQYVTVAMNIGFFLAIVVSVPYVLYSLYAFIVPALTRSERVGLLKSIPLSIGLFIFGFMYGTFILYYALELFAAINLKLGIANIWNISQFISEIFVTSALLGLIFEFPIFLTLLIKLKVTTSETLKKRRRIAYFLALCISALLPPVDILSLLAMALPLVVLYEATILVNK